jgi:serine/threonine protein phosphatase PrpC
VNFSDCLLHGATTDVGMRRTNNQDSLAVVLADSYESWVQRGHLFIIADGMGAHAAGELASKLAVDGIPFLFHKYRELPLDEALERSVRETNSEINRRGRANLDFHNMGTTCSALVITAQGAFVAHVGDSRVYRLRGDQIQQLTFDHSLVWEMRASGQLGSDNGDLEKLVPKNVITRSLGPYPTVQVDVEGPFPVELGDTFLLCSDGLSGQVHDDEIGLILGVLPPSEATRVLADLANLRDGPDNVTVIAAKVVDPCLTAHVAGKASGVLSSARGNNDPGAHPAIWILSVVAALGAGVLAILNYLSAAAVLALGAICIFVVGLARQFSLGDSQPAVPKHGRGPYTSTQCSAKAEHVKRFAQNVQALREAIEGSYNVSWDRFNALCGAASQAQQRSDYASAVREYCRAISYLMESVRSQGRKDDESVL